MPWKHNITLMQKVKDKKIRKWYIEKCLEDTWSNSVPSYQIDTNLYYQQEKAIKHNNFELTLKKNSDLASYIMKDPYVFDLVKLTKNYQEKEFASKMGFYLTVLNEEVKDKLDNPSIGIILCQNKSSKIVDYSLKYINKPVGVSEYKILTQISKEWKSNLPTEEEINLHLFIEENDK